MFMSPVVFREFTGNCADTLEQFKSVQEEQGGLPEEYECHQFPDEEALVDKIIVALICTAVALPFTILITEVFVKVRLVVVIVAVLLNSHQSVDCKT